MSPLGLHMLLDWGSGSSRSGPFLLWLRFVNSLPSLLLLPSWSLKPAGLRLLLPRVLLWLSLVPFPGFVTVLSRDEQGGMCLCHLVQTGS